MGKKRHTPEEIIGHLRTIEIELGKGSSLEEAVRKIGTTPHTYDPLPIVDPPNLRLRLKSLA
jgi:hypothetical protein